MPNSTPLPRGIVNGNAPVGHQTLAPAPAVSTVSTLLAVRPLDIAALIDGDGLGVVVASLVLALSSVILLASFT